MSLSKDDLNAIKTIVTDEIRPLREELQVVKDHVVGLTEDVAVLKEDMVIVKQTTARIEASQKVEIARVDAHDVLLKHLRTAAGI